MKFNLQKEKLQQQLRVVAKAAEPEDMILIKAEPGKAVFSLVSRIVSLRITIPAGVLQAGECCVNCRHFCSIVSVMPEGEVTVALNGTGKLLMLQMPCYSLKLPTGDLENTVPYIPVEVDNPVVVSEYVLKTILRDIGYTKTTEVFGDVFFEMGDEKFITTAYDNAQVVKRTVDLNTSETRSCAIKKEIVSILRGLLDEDLEGQVEISLTSEKFGFKVKGFEISGPLSGGKSKPINFWGAMGTPISTVTMERDTLLDTIRRFCAVIGFASYVTEEGKSPVRPPALVEVDRSVHFSLRGSVELDEELTAAISAPGSFQINPVFLKNCLEVFPNEEVSIDVYRSHIRIQTPGYDFIVMCVSDKSSDDAK